MKTTNSEPVKQLTQEESDELLTKILSDTRTGRPRPRTPEEEERLKELFRRAYAGEYGLHEVIKLRAGGL